ncbi:MAG: peptidoglycan bridge formation glycyltransferase FemA/FemB family protein [Bacilli bacterium]|nr:peptidoglycan bridge formation glycyltransferase FemA/FemB family protein [Bacilli bacterium]
MHIVDNISKEEYQNFFEKCPYNHFLQSYEWGEVAKERKQTPIYLALVDDNNKIHAACLAMRKHVPIINKYYYYSPRGILIDYNNHELLEEFTICLKDYLKKNNAIYFKIDPALIYEDIDTEGKPIINDNNNYELYNYLLKLGYKHHGFNKLFENNQPRYTFRIDTMQPFETIESNMNKSFLKTVKRSEYYDLEITNDYNNDTFYELMQNVANKDSFTSNSKKMYELFDSCFSKEKHVEYITIKIYPDKILEKSQNELNNIQEGIKNGSINNKRMADTNNLIARYQKDIDTFTPYKDKYPDGIVSLILICPKTSNSMWTLYIGNNELATYTFAVNRAYFEAIKRAHELKLNFLDLFGTVGDPNTTKDNYAGIHEYKRKMGGTYTEFIGEFDLIINKFWYKVLPTIINLYRKIKKSHK